MAFPIENVVSERSTHNKTLDFISYRCVLSIVGINLVSSNQLWKGQAGECSYSSYWLVRKCTFVSHLIYPNSLLGMICNLSLIAIGCVHCIKTEKTCRISCEEIDM